ncbi:uncharacterized protein Z520_08169 [Fonsecaea multimorphosa CBS 102226]|uniref:DUF7892 domain-containing protein n=1 Tax=Fonsecaea multimorphosa CBS 102226 TaxID=1442371 RepID=A0A0D2JZD8_9EURO|nr:uncharacterized protein Z520_08169 [Fonsecaea multimorphosa CBS 102226]KIX95914.1 hypothetical protein Z520_08169 [Fonsecaea multimorphosa CBS 102226]OAL21685.1 hypothetical protein AYO22_07627 [Fonsecaea multimorphosa]
MNPYYPPPLNPLPAPSPRMPSSTAQVLGKRKHDHSPAMPPSAQSGAVGVFSSQILGHRFPVRQFREPLSIEFMTSKYQRQQTSLPVTTLPSKPTAPARPTIFVHNTVQTIQGGKRPKVDRTQTQPLFRDSDDRSVQRPRPPLQPPRPKRLALLPSRPLQNSKLVHADAWVDILGFCDPKLLLEAKTLNRFFYNLLSDNSAIWRKSRLNHYGSNMPDCPKGLTEKQYVELLAGRGCQNKTCPVEGTSKVHWMFLVRLCPECFKMKTQSEAQLPREDRHRLPATEDRTRPGDGRPLWELLPLARTDGRRGATSRHVDTEANDWVRDRGKFAFLKTSFKEIKTQYLHLSTSDDGDSALVAWASKIHRETMEFMADVNKLEAWLKEHAKTVQKSKAEAQREQRIEYFEARAAAQAPPMDRQILWKMAAFTRILKILQDGNERSWDLLWIKIEPYRSHAQQVVEFERLMASDFLETVPQVRLFRRLHEHRCGRESVPRAYQPEQKFVLRLAEAVFSQCVNDRVANEDLLLMCLRNVFATYRNMPREKRPRGLNFDGTTGPYCLSLDDARMIVKDVLERQISVHSERGRIVFQSLKCRGCRRADHVRTFSFVEAFEHILQTHARKVGEGLEYYRFAIPHPLNDLSGLSPEAGGVEYKFPWYTVQWPENLPLVPRHQEKSESDTWHPDFHTEFVPLAAPLRMSAFHGRQALGQNHAADDFGPNLIHAAKRLHGVKLDGPCQMKIALKYALDLWAQRHTREPPLSTFMACLDNLAIANPSIELKFRCRICLREDRRPRTSRKSKHKITMESLHNHWELKHREGSVPWTKGFMALPSEEEISQQIAHVDKKLQEQKDSFREKATAPSIRKRAKSKGNVLFEVKESAEVFDTLFPKVAGH